MKRFEVSNNGDRVKDVMKMKRRQQDAKGEATGCRRRRNRKQKGEATGYRRRGNRMQKERQQDVEG